MTHRMETQIDSRIAYVRATDDGKWEYGYILVTDAPFKRAAPKYVKKGIAAEYATACTKNDMLTAGCRA